MSYRSVFIVGLCLSSVFAVAQSKSDDQKEMVEPIPAEIGKLAFMAGTFDGDLTIHVMGSSSTSHTHMHCEKALNGRFYRGDETYTFGEAKIAGMQLCTYDELSKQYKGYWFDQESADGLKLVGGWQGSSLVLTSDPSPVPGMPKKETFRATWTPGSNGYDFKLEMKDEDATAFTAIIEGHFAKSKGK